MDSNTSVAGRGLRSAILPPVVANQTARSTLAVQQERRVDASMKELSRFDTPSAAASQQNNSQVIYAANNGSTDASTVSQGNAILPNGQWPPVWNNDYCPSTVNLERGFDGVSIIDVRTNSQRPREIYTNQIVRYEGPNVKSATAAVKKGRLRKNWEQLVCHKCINAKHSAKHLEINGAAYKGISGALSCKSNGCRKWTSSLWNSEFIRSEDCRHGQSAANSNNTDFQADLSFSTPTEDRLAQKDHLGQSPLARSKQSQNKVSKSISQQLPFHRTNTKKSRKRSEQQSKANSARRDLKANEITTCHYEPSEAFKPTQSRVPPGVDVTNGYAAQAIESFNLDILRTYQGKYIEAHLVENKWARIAVKISEFDNVVRGIASNKEVRDSLLFLDKATPLSDLREICEEFKSPQEHDSPSTLLLLFKSMFKVPMYTSLKGMTCDQMRKLKFTYVLRATLGYLLHLKIFCEPKQKSEWQEMEKRAITLCGEQQGAALLQYIRLGAHQSDHFKETLGHRARTFALSIHTTLAPLWAVQGGWYQYHNQEKQLELLTKLTHDCLDLAADLHAREGTFNFIWPLYGDRFNSHIHTVDRSQCDAVAKMTEEVLGRQLIALTMMPVVERVLSYEKVPLPYARGLVLLQEPYIE